MAGAGEAKEGEGTRKDRPRKKERPREQRERPAFNYGDVVFGKLVEITDDALFIDLSGKALAIFDRRELDLPDDLEYGADPDDMDDEPVAPETHAEGEAVAGADASVVAADGEKAVDAGVEAAVETPAAEIAPEKVASAVRAGAGGERCCRREGRPGHGRRGAHRQDDGARWRRRRSRSDRPRAEAHESDRFFRS